MEIEGKDGTKLCLKPGVKAVFGRGAGFNTDDITVSRRHVSVEFKPAAGETERPDRVSFEVLGRNPVWVRAGGKGEKIRTYRKSETGEIATGEQFCVSGHRPIWFNLKRRDEVMEERVSDDESGLDSIDISDIDPVKEFGFLVIGKEFDQYPKSRLRDAKQWEWFLEDTRKGNSDDDDDDDEDEDKKGKKGLSKKRRRKKENDDDNWSAESEEDKELLVKSKRVVRPTYSTRSKKTKKDTNASSSSNNRAQTKQRGSVDDEDEDEETLGGFIVSDEDAKLEESDEEEEEEVEDCDEDEDDEE